MAIEAFLTHWGLAAVFAGAMMEGESFVIGGGALAQRDVLVAWQVALAAFAGSVAMDQICFALGRRCREQRWVRAVCEKPAAQAAMGFLENHPNGYIFAFRYLYGLRIVTPLAIGLTRVSAARFAAINMLSAAIWAMAFTGIGYMAGDAIERTFGRVQSVLLLLLVVIVLAGVSGAIAHHIVAKRKRPERSRSAGVTEISH